MKVLVVFETFEGQTGKIAAFVAERVREAGHDVRKFNTEDRLASVTFEDIDRVILAAPVHERRHPKAFEVFVAASLEDLNAHPNLMISVSLKAAFPDGLEEAHEYLAEMEMRTGFKPDRETLAAGAVRTESYDYFESQVVRDVALAGHDVELVNGVREFTDWEELRAVIDDFLKDA